jgi:hypothetical protein
LLFARESTAHRSQLNSTSTIASPPSQPDNKLNGGTLHKQSQLHGTGGNILAAPASAPDNKLNGGKLHKQSQLHGSGRNIIASPPSALEKGGALAGKPLDKQSPFAKTTTTVKPAAAANAGSPGMTPNSKQTMGKTSLW